jgi:hypothetical protein
LTEERDFPGLKPLAIGLEHQVPVPTGSVTPSTKSRPAIPETPQVTFNVCEEMLADEVKSGPTGSKDNNDLKQLLYQLAVDKVTAKLKIAELDFFYGDEKNFRT